MTIEATLLPQNLAGIAKRIWITPQIHALNINAAAGATPGPLCDKHGSLSATEGNDHCDVATK
jgi:hypothetical protein